MATRSLALFRSAAWRFPRQTDPSDAGIIPVPPSPTAVGRETDGPDSSLAESIATIRHLEGNQLGLEVARLVMGWRLVSGHHADTWVDSEGALTGYYDGRPFSPYRDRNALVVVWDRIAALGLQPVYARFLSLLVSDGSTDPWVIQTCDPGQSCRAAILAVRFSD